MGKLIVVVPIVQGNGGKYITMNLATALKTEKGGKVAIADFNVRNPYLCAGLTDDRIHGVDNLIDKIDGGVLNQTLFSENMIELKNGIHLLKGTKLIGRHKIFNLNHVNTIVKFLKETYDNVFIAITSDTDNAFTIGALSEADEIILVSRNNYSTINAFNRVVEVVNHYKKNNDISLELIHNMYTQTTQTKLATLISENDVKVLGSIEYDETSIDNLNLVSSGMKLFKSKNKNEEPIKQILSKIL